MQTISQEIAFISKAMRRKYGRYPLPFRTWVAGLPIPWWPALPGHENDEIPAFPDISEKGMMRRPFNREDDRRRFGFHRQENFTKSLHKRINDMRIPWENESEDDSENGESGSSPSSRSGTSTKVAAK